MQRTCIAKLRIQLKIQVNMLALYQVIAPRVLEFTRKLYALVVACRERDGRDDGIIHRWILHGVGHAILKLVLEDNYEWSGV